MARVAWILRRDRLGNVWAALASAMWDSQNRADMVLYSIEVRFGLATGDWELLLSLAGPLFGPTRHAMSVFMLQLVDEHERNTDWLGLSIHGSCSGSWPSRSAGSFGSRTPA